MNANTKKLHALSHRLWIDNISRERLVKGVFSRYIDDYFVTGLTSNLTIFKHAIDQGDSYDNAIAKDTLRNFPDCLAGVSLPDNEGGFAEFP